MSHTKKIHWQKINQVFIGKANEIKRVKKEIYMELNKKFFWGILSDMKVKII